MIRLCCFCELVSTCLQTWKTSKYHGI